ncbi:DUF3703 domain-containing protein [Streptosporangium roseum]|nr:DUF3703 domain-containing protein [Streptosporangium roseum]
MAQGRFRTIVVAPGSALGRFPEGTGLALVGLTQPMPLPEDLAALLQATG